MNSTNPSKEKNRLWKDLTEEFRRACLLRRHGDSEEANKILEEDLPMLISRWSQASASTDATKKEQLNQMFEKERERIDDAWLLQQMMLRQMRDVLIPGLCLQVAEEVRDVMEEQVGEITRKLATLERSEPKPEKAPEPTPQFDVIPREMQPAAGSTQSNRIVAMPRQTAPAEPPPSRPSFDDLPAIIDQIVSGERGYDFRDPRVAALV